MTLVDFCEKTLDGEKEKYGVPETEVKDAIGTITSSMKQQALDAGFLFLGPFPKDKSFTIVNQSFKKSPEKMGKKVIDNNDPFARYYPPSVVEDILTVLESPKTSNIWLFGPTQCGKSVSVDYVGYKLKRKVDVVNCLGDMPSSHFFGRNTVVIDPVLKQNHIQFIKGIVEKSMTEGLDENGKVIGNPGILFIDEASSMPPLVAIGLNRTLQTNKNERDLILPEDGNRLVKSHPGWKTIFAGNTNGNGTSSIGSQIYAAQRRAMDASLMERMTMTFRFGYDRRAEQEIVNDGLEPNIVERFLQFKQMIRGALLSGDLMTPFSTKRIIDICEAFKIYRNNMEASLALAKAVYYTSFEKLMDEEKTKYNELFHPLFNLNLSDMAPKDDADFL